MLANRLEAGGMTWAEGEREAFRVTQRDLADLEAPASSGQRVEPPEGLSDEDALAAIDELDDIGSTGGSVANVIKWGGRMERGRKSSTSNRQLPPTRPVSRCACYPGNSKARQPNARGI